MSIDARLQSLKVSNFRSIRGSVTLPLNASVVLVHGSNGAGKTSLLSAIEMAATGSVPSMARADPDYRDNLVHRGASASRLELNATGLDAEASSSLELSPDGQISKGVPLLNSEQSRFLSERCLLPQSTLARLLEIYEFKRKGKDSALTQYVRDLLRLDVLDHLIDGLHPARNIRRTRNFAPSFLSAEDAAESARSHVQDLRSRVKQLSDEEVKSATNVGAALGRLSPGLYAPDALQDAEALAAALNAGTEDQDLRDLLDLRTELNALEARAGRVDEGAASQLLASEHHAGEARTVLDEWRAENAGRLDGLLDRADALVPGIASNRELGTADGIRFALQRFEAELNEARQNLVVLGALAEERGELESDLEKDRERLRISENRLGELAPEVSVLAGQLAELIQHAETDVCPVCLRDFGELGQGSLAEHLSRRVAGLTEQAGQLEALSTTRSSLTRSVAAAESRLDEIEQAVGRHAGADQLRQREIQLSDLEKALTAALPGEVRGEELAQASRTAQARLDKQRVDQSESAEVARSISEITNRLGTEPQSSVSGSIEAARSSIDRQVTEVQRSRESRSEALAGLRELIDIRARLLDLHEAVVKARGQRDEANRRLHRAEAVMHVGRDVHKAAEAARSTLIRQVFNDSLNAVWRDLFVRLAPREPFVPRFKVPQVNGSVEAVLETVDREGKAAGRPGSMLSAGNLNTAALTLFLALHLQFEPTLPWLVLDDPVQSMDEVHVSQFAALLRALSRDQNRQIIVAVHERPLFEYLRLELTPAFEGDSLIAAEIVRAQNSDSAIISEFVPYTPDAALAG